MSHWYLIVAGTAVAGLAGVAYWRLHGKPVMTPEKRQQYHDAMNRILDVEKLEAIASKFHGEGHTEEADKIRARIKLRKLPKDVKEARTKVMRKALQSDDKVKVLNIAEIFEREGATGCASELRKYAEGLSE